VGGWDIVDTGRGFIGLMSAGKSITLVNPEISKGFQFLKTETKNGLRNLYINSFLRRPYLCRCHKTI